MAGSNETNTQAPVQTEGWEDLWVYILYVCQGIIIGGGNFLLSFSIARYRALHSKKDLVVVMGLTFADGFNQMAFLTAGIYRIFLLLRGLYRTLLTPLQCMFTPHVVIWAYSETLASMMLTVVSLDRVLAVSFPLRYLKWRANLYGFCVVGVPYLFVFSFNSITWYIAFNQDQIPNAPARCWIESVIGAAWWYLAYYSNASQVFGIGSVVLYLLVGVMYKKNVGKVSASSQESSTKKRQLQRQRRLTISLGISVLCTLLLSVIPLSLAHLITNLNFPPMVSMAMFILSNANPLCNVIIFFKRQPELRIAVRSMLVCKSMPPDLRMWNMGQSVGGSTGPQSSNKH